jgi:hypothetical protein
VEQLLQQGHALPAAAAVALLQDSQTQEGRVSRQQWQQLLEWLSALCRSAPPAAASPFLFWLLIISSNKQPEQQQLSPDQSWQLYELLLSCQEEWGPEQQGIPAAAADGLIQQQRVDHGGGAKRLIQVWDHFSKAAAATEGTVCFLQLQPATQEKVLTGLVTTGDDQHAVSLVQVVPQLLPTLAAAWQQVSRRVDVGLLEAALRLASLEGRQEAARAAEGLLGLAREQQAGEEVLRTELPDQLLQVLCEYGKVVTAAGLLSRCLGSSPAVVSFFRAAAKQPMEEQIRALAGIGVGMGRNKTLENKQQQQQQLLGSLDQLLELENAAAVGLFWEVLVVKTKQSDIKCGVRLAALSILQLQQVVALCCSSRPSPAAPSFTARELATEAMQCSLVLSGDSVARLITAVVKDHEELQPCRAAVLLGVVREEQLMGAGGSSSSGGNGGSGGSRRSPGEGDMVGEVNAAGLAGTLALISQLCLSQLGNASSSNEVEEVEDATDWVARYSPELLSPEAAAAALFAVWYGQQQQQQEEGFPAIFSPLAAGVMGLSLYHAARKGSTLSAAAGWTAKPSLDSVVLDLAPAAAVGAEQWEEGKACLLFATPVYNGMKIGFMLVRSVVCVATSTTVDGVCLQRAWNLQKFTYGRHQDCT